MAEERVRRCDGDNQTCPRRGKSVATYRVEWPGSHFQADLCREHSKPLFGFISNFPDHFVVKMPDSARRGFQIHTMEEIERLKRRR